MAPEREHGQAARPRLTVYTLSGAAFVIQWQMGRKANARSLALDRKHSMATTILELSRELVLEPLKCLGVKGDGGGE